MAEKGKLLLVEDIDTSSGGGGGGGGGGDGRETMQGMQATVTPRDDEAIL
jgi:hypothetical protein